jgi:hypothetical protein
MWPPCPSTTPHRTLTGEFLQNEPKLISSGVICFRRSMLALALLPLAACGFHPLYSEAVQRDENPQLAGIIVSQIPDRYGQQLELALREALNPEGLSVKAALSA